MQIIYSVFLIQTAWHDLRNRRIPVWIFLLFGLIGALSLCVSLQISDSWKNGTGIGRLAAFIPGLLMIGMTVCTSGQIGAGDGIFFLISAFYLPVKNVVFLLLSGLIFCSAFCLGMIVWGAWNGMNVRKMRLPFLPFMVPAWFWMMFFWQKV